MRSGSDIDCRLDSHCRRRGQAQSGTCGQHKPFSQEALGLINGIFHLSTISVLDSNIIGHQSQLPT